MTGFTLHPDEATTLVHDPEHGRQPEAASFPHPLGGEERLEDVLLDLGDIPEPVSLTNTLTYSPGLAGPPTSTTRFECRR